MTDAPPAPGGTRAFAPFEWMIALRYLRAKRQESFVSVISGFSLVGIALGVATLIIVMAVMNGFRHELLSRILGLNGHVIVQSLEGGLAELRRRGGAGARGARRHPRGAHRRREVMATAERTSTSASWCAACGARI